MIGLQSESGPPKRIIYVQQKARAVELWGMLSSVDSNQQVGLHHSSLRNETRQKVETEFRQGKTINCHSNNWLRNGKHVKPTGHSSTVGH